MHSRCFKSELDLFTRPLTQISIDNVAYIDYPSKTSVKDDGPIEFSISGSDAYVSLADSYLDIEAKILKSDGTALLATDKVGPTNQWFDSLFSRVDLELNNVLVSDSTNTYPYRAMFETLLHTGKDAQESQYTMSLFYKDTAGKMDVTDPAGLNEGLKKRAEFTQTSKTVQMRGRLHLDMFQQNKLLLNHVDIMLRLIRSEPQFALMGEGDTFKIAIQSATLHLCKVKVAKDTELAHEDALREGTAKYPIRRTITKTYTISQGDNQISKDDVFLGEKPDVVILAIVDAAAYSGSLNKNPFNFEHNNINHVNILVDGVPHPAKELLPDFAGDRFLEAYHTLYSGNGTSFTNTGNCINREEYKNGYTIIQRDLSSDQSGYDYIKSENSSGNVRIDIKFATALTSSKILIVQGIHIKTIEIDRNRDVRFDYRS
jgi:hypothetical protein